MTEEKEIKEKTLSNTETEVIDAEPEVSEQPAEVVNPAEAEAPEDIPADIEGSNEPEMEMETGQTDHGGYNRDNRNRGRGRGDRPMTAEDKFRAYKRQSDERLLDIKRSRENKIGKKRKKI